MEESAQPTACPDCHAVTDDLAAHERWHARLVRDIAVAVNNENKRRDAAARALNRDRCAISQCICCRASLSEHGENTSEPGVVTSQFRTEVGHRGAVRRRHSVP